MLRGMYDGTEQRLRQQGVLLMPDPDNEDNYLAQFDGFHLPEAYGWHSFPKKDFVNIEGQDEED